jgi:hypothetical protein
MNKLIICVVIAVNVLSTHGFLFGDGAKWNDLKRTWGINPFGNAYVSLPRTTKDAVVAGWVMDKNCSQINGNRYVLKGDRMVMLLFNADGDIAGISAGVPKNTPFNFPSDKIKPFFTDEGDFQTITAYFTDPATVCKPQKSRLLTGDRLVFVNSDKNIEVALKESDVSPFWTQGKCFYTMGNHYWADLSGKVSAQTNIDDFVPIFLQYNKGNLNGFGWAFNFNSPSPNVEHPPQSALDQFFKETPSVFRDPTKVGTLTTLHIYLDSTPLLNYC